MALFACHRNFTKAKIPMLLIFIAVDTESYLLSQTAVFCKQRQQY